MDGLSIPVAERSRAAFSRILQSMQEPGTARIAAIALGVSEATVSRTKTEKLEDAIALVYQLGFKVVDQGRVCVDRGHYEAIATIASAAMAKKDFAMRLMWEDE